MALEFQNGIVDNTNPSVTFFTVNGPEVRIRNRDDRWAIILHHSASFGTGTGARLNPGESLSLAIDGPQDIYFFTEKPTYAPFEIIYNS